MTFSTTNVVVIVVIVVGVHRRRSSFVFVIGVIIIARGRRSPHPPPHEKNTMSAIAAAGVVQPEDVHIDGVGLHLDHLDLDRVADRHDILDRLDAVRRHLRDVDEPVRLVALDLHERAKRLERQHPRRMYRLELRRRLDARRRPVAAAAARAPAPLRRIAAPATVVAIVAPDHPTAVWRAAI